MLGELERRRGGNIPCEECSRIRGAYCELGDRRPRSLQAGELAATVIFSARLFLSPYSGARSLCVSTHDALASL